MLSSFWDCQQLSTGVYDVDNKKICTITTATDVLYTRMVISTTLTSTNSCEPSLEKLANRAKFANLLAKQLDGSARLEVYRIKSDTLSLLLIKRWALVDGVRPGGVVGLTILTTPPVRLHVPISSLAPKAQVLAREQSHTVPAVASIADYLPVNHAHRL